MDWNRVEGSWKQIKEQWGRLTNDDLDVIAGKRDQLERKIHERCGLAKGQVKSDVDNWYGRQTWKQQQAPTRRGFSFSLRDVASGPGISPDPSGGIGIGKLPFYRHRPHGQLGRVSVKKLMITAKLAFVVSYGAYAQTSTWPSPAPAPADANAPLAGANSFTEGQAKSRLEAICSNAVSELKEDDNGVWKGKATHGGQQVDVSVDYRGNITRH